MATRRLSQDAITLAMLYSRVSGDEQAKEGLSLPAQLAALRQYVAGRGFAIENEYHDVMKGTRDDRPGYQAMLKEARRLVDEGKRVVIVVVWLHRLGRRVLESVERREELKNLGVAVHSVSEGGEVSDFVANVMASVAEYEVQQLGDRIQAVNEHTRNNGWRVVGRAPWGYRWRPATEGERAEGSPQRVLVVDEETSPSVIDLFRKVATGASVRQASAWAARLPEHARGKRALSVDMVANVLRSPVYKGMGEPDANGESHPGRWPALVDEKLWQRVQERISGHKSRPNQARHLLSGLLRCPVCGNRMAGRSRKGDHGRAPRYVCISKMLGANVAVKGCEFTASMPVVDEAVVGEVTRILDVVTKNDTRTKAGLRKAWKALQSPKVVANAQARITRLEGAASQAKKLLGEAAISLVKGDIDKPAYDAAKEQIERDLNASQEELDRLRAEHGVTKQEALPDLEEVLEEAASWGRVFSEGPTAEKRVVLGLLIDRIVPIRDGRGKYQADITFTPLGKQLRDVTATHSQQ